MKIYVGNLAEDTTENELREAFGAYGEVGRVAIVADKQTGLPRGFGFVEMNMEQGTSAIAGLDGSSLGDRALKVNEAKPRSERNGKHSKA